MERFFAATNMAIVATTGWGGDDNYMYRTYLDIQPTVPRKTTVRCEYCLTKNKLDEPSCVACGAWLPDEDE